MKLIWIAFCSEPLALVKCARCIAYLVTSRIKPLLAQGHKYRNFIKIGHNGNCVCLMRNTWIETDSLYLS